MDTWDGQENVNNNSGKQGKRKSISSVYIGWYDDDMDGSGLNKNQLLNNSLQSQINNIHVPFLPNQNDVEM